MSTQSHMKQIVMILWIPRFFDVSRFVITYSRLRSAVLLNSSVTTMVFVLSVRMPQNSWLDGDGNMAQRVGWCVGCLVLLDVATVHALTGNSLIIDDASYMYVIFCW